MKVSFIVPVYNVERYLVCCVKSILAQKYTAFEIILIDDGSKDNSGEICDKLSKKYSSVKVIHQENSGVSAARNQGLRIAQGDWICFIDSDDAVTDDLLETYWNFLNDEYDVCFLNYVEVQSKEFSKRNTKRTMDGNITIFEKDDFREFLFGTFNRDIKGKYDYHQVRLALPVKFYRRRFLTDNNIYFIEGVSLGEDAIFNLDVYKNAKRGCYINKTTYFYRQRLSSASNRYVENIENEFAYFHKNLEIWLRNNACINEFSTVLAERKVWSLGFCCLQKYCNSKNPMSYKQREKQFLTERKKYESDLKKINLQDFRLNKRILFYLMRKKQFFFINLLCLLNKLL